MHFPSFRGIKIKIFKHAPTTSIWLTCPSLAPPPQLKNLLLDQQLDPLDISSPNTFITRITPTKDNVDFSWKLLKDKLMKAANPKKATGPDNVTPGDFSLVGDSAIHSLLPIFNKSMRDSTFPGIWKLSRVNPIFKKGSPTDVNNYRPISLLSVPGTILEDSLQVTP